MFSFKTILFKKGFSLVEIIIAVSILSILTTMALLSMSDHRDRLLVKTTTDTLISRLEETKTKAQAGKNNEDQGIKIFNDSYILFSGNSYSSSDSENQEFEISNSVELIFNEDEFTFEKITGEVNNNITIKVSLINNASTSINLIVDENGTITKK